MRKNAKLNIRLESEDLQLMKEAIEKFNSSDSGLELNQNSFIRMAIKLLSKKIMKEGLSIEFKP